MGLTSVTLSFGDFVKNVYTFFFQIKLFQS